jgi:hypothetical protein
MACAVCGASTPTNLCDECASGLDVPVPFVGEQLLSASVTPQPALLLDVWGRVHALEKQTTVGRTPRARGISILHASISRRHATLSVDSSGTWWLEDLGSSNGTRVNDEPIARHALAFGDRIAFGAVGMYFIADDGHRVSLDTHELASRTLKSEEAAPAQPPARGFDAQDATSGGLAMFAMTLVEAPAGGGGFLEAAGARLQLSITQYAMLEMLVARMRDQADVSELVRGFVPSGQLIADLPWEATDPDEGHLKQLVRRMRRSLDTIRLGGIIESRRGFGYRLRVIPR